MSFASSSASWLFVRAFFVCVLLFTAIASTEARPDFAKCWNQFINDQTNSDKYTEDTSIIYQGRTYLHHEPSPEERKFIVSTEGCRLLCGPGIQYYHWSQIASTITTWVLPIMGSLLQAPYEGNAFRKTLYAIVRWIGSPIASLSYILWNIKVIGKCALLSDMSTPFKMVYRSDLEKAILPGQECTEKMLDMRDSLYILSVMNQYTVKSPINLKHAETLLRVALFADAANPTGRLDLSNKRKKLASNLREGRKRGIVPVFITLMWFLFSLAISIESAFASLGENATAHDLALGLLLAWFPVLILSSIVDRNPTQTAKACEKLNKLLGEVQLALREEGAKDKLIQAIDEVNLVKQDQKGGDNHAEVNPKGQDKLIQAIGEVNPEKQDNEVGHNHVEVNPKGQNNGVGHDHAEVNPKGQDNRVGHNHAEKLDLGWVGEAEGTNGANGANGAEGVNKEDLAYKFFHGFAGQGRVRWHYGVAHPILAGMERIILADSPLDGNSSFLGETKNARGWLVESKEKDITKYLIGGRGGKPLLLHFDRREFWEILSAFLIVIGAISGAFTVSFRTPTIGLGCRAGGYAIFGTIAAGLFFLEMLTWYAIVTRTTKVLEKTEKLDEVESQELKLKLARLAKLDWAFRFCELVNTAWLVYIIMAQTLGSYQNCDCQAANWGHDGGYINAKVAVKADGSTVEAWWIAGVLLSSLIMFIAIAFLIVEWCEQSHLNTVDPKKAMDGLRVTKRFKAYTIWARMAPNYFIRFVKFCWRRVTKNPNAKEQESIRWRK